VAGNIYNVLIGEKAMAEVVRPTAVPYLDIIPAHPDL
jgi:cellulose biosynthesis protein BcsQ